MGSVSRSMWLISCEKKQLITQQALCRDFSCSSLDGKFSGFVNLRIYGAMSNYKEGLMNAVRKDR